ncbi:hypothetical protein [Mangrovibacterium marinum]|uniref:Uncharacterized protein n=1 Tax=Mangrovibacterium marinum TaxID=1639118 RepID=A0A2T5BYD5_9BACT|nr:hypothetical protein [Mangrovibacterium marinum]PTN07244.1 hypothetical protein C8N47_12029 [Mangrovibacterium marinum]
MKLTFFILTLLILASCAGYRTTSLGSVAQHLGVDRDYIIAKYGSPFKVEAYTKDNNAIEILSYKEVVDVESYSYILTSDLYFENNILLKISQQEDVPPGRTIISTNKKEEQ